MSLSAIQVVRDDGSRYTENIINESVARDASDRRINFNDLMVYKERIDRATAQGLDEMVAISQELGLYD